MAFVIDSNWNWASIAAALSANQNDWNPSGLSGASVIWINASTPVTITGLQGGAERRILIIALRVGSSNVTIAAESVSSTAAHRFQRGLTLAIGGTPDQTLIGALFMYIGSRWRWIL